ncbi:MAG: hypothetical protein M0R16_13355 [Bacteroidales bacterium]|jgi:lysophospholipase L1-like esterase|nr:hypothetical protein [Bacteroidales bacterium]
MIKKLFKLIAINIVVFIGLLITVNLLVILIFQGHKIINKEIADTRGNLPNYKNIDWAHKHFKEFKELPTEYRSYIGWRRLSYKGETININEQGIRNTSQSPLATEKSPLVVFLGGSTMWGTGVNDANTIPSLFAKVAQGRYRAMNLGEAAYNAFQGYVFLKLQIINGLNPYVVVSYDGVNDAQVLMPDRRPFSHNRENQIRKAMEGKDRIKDETLSFSHFLLNPLKSFIAKCKVYYTKNHTYKISQNNAEQKAKVLLDSWLCAKELAETHGAYFVAVLQPNAAIGKPYLKHLKLSEKEISIYKLFYPVVLELLKTPKYQELHRHVLVLTDVFDSEENIYVDAVHVSPKGNKIIAEKIYNHINNSIHRVK